MQQEHLTVCVVLHNLLKQRLGRGQFQPDKMRFNLDDVLQVNQLPKRRRNTTEAAKTQGSVLADYWRSEGAVPWQMDRI